MRAASLAGVVACAVSLGQTAPAPKFEVASIRPSANCDGPGGGRSAGSRPAPSGRLNLKCNTLADLIQQAYVLFANGQFNRPVAVPLAAEPAWVNSDRYDINAKAEDGAKPELMSGPMLQELLSSRFRLKLHRETREIPVYALTVAKGGSKLHPFREGSCTPVDYTKFPQPPPGPGQRPCSANAKRTGGNVIADLQGLGLDDFTKVLLRGNLDRPVIDKTGINGLFDFHLEFAPDQSTPGFKQSDEAAGGPSIFTAVQEQLGLKLEATKGPGEFLVIDSVERPSEN